MAKEVWADEAGGADGKAQHQKEMVFPIGAPNDGFAQYFVGRSYLQPLSTSQVGVYNVTFEPGCRNNWHIHHAGKGGGQILICVAGRGWYQEWGKEARALHPGDVVNIPHGREALARRRGGQLVLPPGPGGARRELPPTSGWRPSPMRCMVS